MQALQCQNYLCNIEPCLFLSESTTLVKMSEQLTPTYIICKTKHSDYHIEQNHGRSLPKILLEEKKPGWLAALDSNSARMKLMDRTLIGLLWTTKSIKVLYIFVVKALYIFMSLHWLINTGLCWHMHKERNQYFVRWHNHKKTSKLSTFCTSKKYKQAFLLKVFLTFHNRTMAHTYTNLKKNTTKWKICLYIKSS